MPKTKITITPEMREYNEMVEHADFLTDYQFDHEPALVLLERLQQAKAYPNSAKMLARAIVGLSVKH